MTIELGAESWLFDVLQRAVDRVETLSDGAARRTPTTGFERAVPAGRDYRVGCEGNIEVWRRDMAS